jgi:hypothetical protein
MSNDPLQAGINNRQRMRQFAREFRALADEYAGATDPLRHLLNEILRGDPALGLKRFHETQSYLSGCDFVGCSWGNYLNENETDCSRLAEWGLMRLAESLSKGDQTAHDEHLTRLSKDPGIHEAAQAVFRTFCEIVLSRKYKAARLQFRERAVSLARSYGHELAWPIFDEFKKVGETFPQLAWDACRHWLDSFDAHAVVADGFLQGLGWRSAPTETAIDTESRPEASAQDTNDPCDEPVAQPVDSTSEAEPPAPAAVSPASKPVPKPFVPLSGWPAIIDAISEGNGEGKELTDNEEMRELIRKLTLTFNGPIRLPSKGGRPTVDKVRLQEWWGTLSDLHSESEEETNDRAESERLSVESAHLYSRDGTVIPEIGGGEKKRRGT